MNKIIVKELFSSAFSESKALILRNVIQEKIDLNESVELDFTGITKFTTLFFNFSTGYFISVLGPVEYNKRITLKGLSELGESTYQSSYNNAIEKYDPEQSEKILSIIENPGE